MGTPHFKNVVCLLEKLFSMSPLIVANDGALHLHPPPPVSKGDSPGDPWRSFAVNLFGQDGSPSPGSLSAGGNCQQG